MKRALWPVLLAVFFAPIARAEQKPAEILAAAKRACDPRPWRVAVHVVADQDMKISGIVAGTDFDLTIEAVAGTTRQITLGEKAWSSADGGKTWQTLETSDRRFYYLAHTPINSPKDKIPPFEEVAAEKGSDESLLHLRFKAPDKIRYEGDRPNFWLTRDRSAPLIRRYKGPAAFENDYVTSDVKYTPTTEQEAILPPPGNPNAQASPPGPEALLMAAMGKMASGVWAVKGTASFKKTIAIHGLLAGRDFDLTMETETGAAPIRGIVIKDKAWVSSDGGKSFRAGTPDDRLVYNLAHTPILAGRLEPAFEKVGVEEHGDESWLHLQLKVPEKIDPKELPQYWVVLDRQGQALYIRRAEMPMVDPKTNGITRCSFEYGPAREKEIAPPQEGEARSEVLAAPVDDKIYGFDEIERRKFDLAGKIVRIEVTPKLLQAAQIGDQMYRAMLKDTVAPRASYGQVEFPGDALVKLGFLKKTLSGAHGWTEYEEAGALGRTEGAPVSFYARIIPIGREPAARCVAVGSKLLRAADGKISYSW